MDFGEWIGKLPLGFVFLLTLALCLGTIEAGAALAGVVVRRIKEKEPDSALGALVGSMLALLGFMLAFTFGMTASRFDTRKQLVLQESNAIGTTYLRAGLMPPAEGLEIRRLLREYVDGRMALNTGNIQETMKKAEELHLLLWAQTKLLVKEDMDSDLRSLFVLSLNELIDVHQSRKTVGLQFRVPGMIWLGMYLLTVLSMLAVGYQIGMSGIRRLRGMPVLAASFSLVIMLIADVDRPGTGFVRVNQQPIADVQQMMLQDSP